MPPFFLDEACEISAPEQTAFLAFFTVTLAAVVRKECVGHHGEGKGKIIVFMSTCDAVDFYFKVCVAPLAAPAVGPSYCIRFIDRFPVVLHLVLIVRSLIRRCVCIG